MNTKTETAVPAVPAVYAAVAAVMGDLAKSGISKDETNTFDKYKFRGIDAVYNALAPLLSKHGLLILPRVLERHSEERASQKGGALFYVTVAVEFDFVAAADGSKHTIRAYGEAMDRGDKGTNKAMTAAYKYACFEAFCIPTEGSDDADAETHEVTAKAEQDALADEWLSAIDSTVCVEDLDALAPQIAKLPDAIKPKLRAAFGVRKHAFDKAAA